MSSDDFYIIRKDAYGFFVPLHAFASDEYIPIISLEDIRFQTLDEAIKYAAQDSWTEYGVQVHEECYENFPAILKKEVNGHYYGCTKGYSTFMDFLSEENCTCDIIYQEWHTKVLPEK